MSTFFRPQSVNISDRMLWRVMTNSDMMAPFLNSTFREPRLVIHSYFKTNEMHYFSQIYFWNRNLHVSDSFSVHHQEFSTLHTAIGICHAGLLTACPAFMNEIYIIRMNQRYQPHIPARSVPRHTNCVHTIYSYHWNNPQPNPTINFSSTFDRKYNCRTLIINTTGKQWAR
jgi:hypothetical protein